MKQSILIYFVLLITVILCFLIWFCFFSDNMTLKEKWVQRKEELKNVDPILYKIFFNKIENKTLPSAQKNGKIFISVASYRDDQCLSTVQNLAEMADSPELLRIVVCQQNEESSDSDCKSWCNNTKKHPACKLIDIERLDHKEARGPCWARWNIQQRYEGEEFFLQIDAHTRVTKHWDTILKNQLSLCNSSKPCLTQYPPEFKIVKDKDRKDQSKENWQVDKLRSGLYVQKFGNDGFTRIQSDWTKGVSMSPYVSKAWAAGFSFSSGDFIKEVPYDFYTPFLFFGEEMDIAIRGYTNGWKFFSPTVSCLFTNYRRDHRKTFWENKNQEPCEVLSRFRIYHRLGLIKTEDIPEKYHFILLDQIPMGEFCSIQDYCDFAGIDIKNEKLLF
jgi:hypothetical protein